MPKTRITPETMMDRALTAAIVKWQELHDSDSKKISALLGMGRSTFYSRLRRPETFDIRTLRVMVDRGILGPEDITAALGLRPGA